VAPDGDVEPLGDGVVARCIVICFAWFVVLILVWDMLDVVMSK